MNQGEILEVLRKQPMTMRQLGEHFNSTKFLVQPRIWRLKKHGEIVGTPQFNEQSRRWEIIWKVTE